MKHQLFRLLSIASLPVILIACSNADVERVKTSSGLMGSMLPAGMRFGEVVEHSKVCTSPKWDHGEDDYKQAIVEFSCTVSSSSEMIESQRKASEEDLERAKQDAERYYPKLVERASAKVSMDAPPSSGVMQAERARLASYLDDIRSYESALATDESPGLIRRNTRGATEQQLARVKSEFEQLKEYIAQQEPVREQQARATANAAKKEYDDLVALGPQYNAAIASTQERVSAEMKKHYAREREYRLRLVFSVPPDRPVGIRTTEWTSEGKAVPRPDGGPGLYSPQDFDASIKGMAQKAMFFDAGNVFRKSFPFDCKSDSYGLGGTCREKNQ